MIKYCFLQFDHFSLSQPYFSLFFKFGKPGTHGSHAQKPVAIMSGKSEKGGVYQPHKNKCWTQNLNI